LLTVFSLNFGLVNLRSKAKLLAISWCAVSILTVNYVLTDYFVKTNDNIILIVWELKYVTEYNIVAILIFLFNKSAFYKFWLCLIATDTKLGTNDIKKTEILVFSTAALTYCYKLMYPVYYCTLFKEYCIKSTLAIVFYQVPILGMDTFLIMYAIMFYSVYHRMKRFVQFVANGNGDVVSSHYLYIYVIESFENNKRVFDYAVSINMYTPRFHQFIINLNDFAIKDRFDWECLNAVFLFLHSAF
jgi:hypothetical protein